MLRRAALLTLMLCLAAVAGVRAQEWGEFANISSTLGVNDSRICIGEASRGDIGCPTYAPTVSATGRLNASAGLTVDTVSLTTAGTTWGYLGSGSSYLPNLNTTNISVSTINGVSASSFGGGASPTNVPAFRAHKNGTNQTVAASSIVKMTFSTKSFDTLNNFDTGTSRFTPQIAGNYIFNASAYCYTATDCYAYIYKNGVQISGQGFGSISSPVAHSTVIVTMNGSTDYVEAYVSMGGSTTLSGSASSTYFEGSLLASGNGLISGTGATALSALTDVALSSPATGQVLTYNGSSWVNATPSATTVISGTTTMVEGWPDALQCNGGTGTVFFDFYAINAASLYQYTLRGDAGANPRPMLQFNANRTFNSLSANGLEGYIESCNNQSISQLYADGKAFNFIGNSGAGGGALGDRLTSGTLAVTANSATSIISLTTDGTTWGYLGSTASYLPNMATNALQVISATTPLTCDSTRAGTLRYNSPTTALELCTGTGWQVMGVGIPAGTISAFASTTCPTGWSEYTPARGRFLRGIDNGAGNDPSGTRVPGDVQTDVVGPHTHDTTGNRIVTTSGGMGLASGADRYWNGNYPVVASTITSGGSTETRPKNVAVTYCQFNGTSNGWNNPLSGGSTSAAGSTGQIQYNTSGSFDASAGLTWDNAASRLTTVNISATALSAPAISATNISVSTINGVSVTNLGGSASPTNVPAFSVHKNDVNQTVTASTWTQVTFNTESFDTYNNFDTGTSRFTPTVAGKYYVSAHLFCTNSSTSCHVAIRKNGSNILYDISRDSEGVAKINSVVDMNGTTDYLEVWGYNTGGTLFSGTNYATKFSASLLASGNGLISGTGASALSGLSDVALSSPATGQVLTYNGSSWVNATPSATSVISGTTTTIEGYPDAISCVSGGDNRMYYMVGKYSDHVFYRFIASPMATTDAYVRFYLNGTYYSASGGFEGDCANKSLSQLYASGQAFNFIGNSGAGGGALGDRLTSGTLAVTANSATSVISLSTAGTTWGYLGSAASYLPNFSSNAISTSSLNLGGFNLTSSSLVSHSAQIAFSVHRNNVNQTVTSGAVTKLLFTTKDIDTNNNFDTSTSRFTPTVAGKYLFIISAYCNNNTAYCQLRIVKNGVDAKYFTARATTSTSAETSVILDMNGSTDYVEAQAVNSGGTTIDGTSGYTRFSGYLLNGGSGGSGGAGVSAMSSLTDVTLTSPVSNSLLVYDGTKWVNKLFQDTVSTSTMVTSWPDAIICTDTGGTPAPTGRQNVFWQMYREAGTNSMIYAWVTDTVMYNMIFTNTGAFSSKYLTGSQTDTFDCEGQSISQLYAAGKAFNFLGGSGTGSTALGDRLTSGTLAVTANSATSVVSLTTNGTTWGYLGSGASYLPNLSSTNISVSTINGITASNYLFASSTLPVFKVNKNGTNQSLAASTWTKLTFSTKELDTNNNFSTATGRFTPTVAGNYMFSGSVYCSGPTCWSAVFKNGANASQNGSNNWAEGMPSTNVILPMNGTTDYVELYAYSNGSAVSGNAYQTYFQGFLLGGGAGSGVSTTGVSAMSSLTDVTLTSPVSNSLLVYDGAKWVNKLFQDTVSTSTMVSGWPDAIRCYGASGHTILYRKYGNAASTNGTYSIGWSALTGGDSDLLINFNTSQNIASVTDRAGSTWSGYYATNCTVGASLSSFYASGNAYNFLGNTGASSGALGDRITSGTLAVTANSATSVVSLTTNGTTWGYLGSGASYLPNLSTNALTLNGLTITSSSLVSTTSQVAFSAYRNGNQTITASTWNKALFTSEAFDTNNNFDTTTSRFTATIPGKYQFNLQTVCSGSSGCYAALYKNGSLVIQNTSGLVYAQTSEVLHLEAGDYVEGYVYNEGNTIMLANATYTRFSGALLNGGTGSGGAGVSAMSSLTDVTLSSPVSNNLLVYDGSKWVNKLFQETVSTSTMLTDWPDAIMCQTGSTKQYFYLLGDYDASNKFYGTTRQSGGDQIWVWFNNTTKNYTSNYNASSYDCVTSAKSISTLYAEGKAFNFLGGTGSTAMGDRITSGTTSILAQSASVAINAPVGVAGRVSASTVQLSDSPADTCDTASVGTFKMVNGRPYVCRQ